MDLEALYLYILSRLPVKQLEDLEWRRKQAGSFKNACAITGLADITNSLVAKLSAENIQILPYYDPLYPKLLKTIFDPPPVLFYKGTLLSADEACIGVVGTRMMTSYGKNALPKITAPLIASGCTIVSGLAYGVDAAAHIEAVNNKARTIAVLGSGLDNASLYPKQHLKLTQEILGNNGLLLSEHPPGEPAYKQHFVARNRIIAGMCLGTVVVECKQKSGALITADYALDFNRSVYAVPGPIYSAFSEGPNNLIKQGAKLVTSGQDILEDLDIAVIKVSTRTPCNTALEQRVLECIQQTPTNFSNILTQVGISPEQLLSTLATLELNNQVKNLGAEGYITL